MINQIIKLIIALLAGFGAAFGLYKKGSSDAILKIRNKELENEKNILKAAEKLKKEIAKKSDSELTIDILRKRKSNNTSK